jgi:hypothetical protein
MTEKESLVRAIHRIMTDEGFRRRLRVTPREVLMAELGISGETYDALLSLAPIMLAGGLFALAAGISPELGDLVDPYWGGWGK